MAATLGVPTAAASRAQWPAWAEAIDAQETRLRATMGKALDPRRWGAHLGGGVTKRRQQHTRAAHSRQQATLHAELDPFPVAHA